MGSTTHSAAELARQCLAKFDEVLLRGVLTENQWVENRRADFNLWVDGVGAMAGKRASLDARFEFRWRELALTKNLLVKLSEYLDNCLDADDEDILEGGKQNIDAAIDNLASIAVAIRQTGRKSRLQKADRSFNPALLDDLRTHLECIALIRPTLSAESHQEHHENDPLWWQNEIKGNLTPLQRRLIEASLRRRNRFLYAQRHSKKLASREAPAFASQTQTVGPQLPEPERVATPSAQMNVQFQQPGPSVKNEKPLTFVPTLSGTSASVPESKLRWKESQDVIQAPKSQITSIAGAAKYPMLTNPRRASSQGMDRMHFDQPKILQCPCCCEALPNSVIQSRNVWKKHPSVNFCPYTCIAENCPMPHVLYRTRAEWEDHLKKHHPKKWKCQLCDVSQTTLFSSVDDLAQHVSNEHRESFPDELLGTLHLWPSLPSIGLDTCPLCRSTGPRDDPILIDHALEHTHDFALRSLPWADLSTERIQGSTTRGIYNLNYLQPVEPCESTGQRLPSMMHIWFEKLEMPKSEQWEQSHIALAELSASRPVTDVREEVSYFTTNNYFASETEGLSLDIQKDQSLSSRTGESLSIAKELNQSPISPEDSVMGGTATLPPSAPPPPSLGLSPQHGTAIVADPRQHGPDMTRVSPTYPGQTPNGPVDFQDRRMSQFAPERTTPDPRPAPFSYDQRHALDTRLDSTFDRQQRPPAVPAIPQGTTPNVPSHMARPGLEPRSDSTKIPDILCNSRRSVEHDVEYKLRIRQQPVAARYCGFADRDRRVIGPPPIVQLMIEGPNLTDEELSAQLRGHYVMSCSIYDETGTRDASFMLEEYRHRRRLIGSLVATSFVGKDEYDEEGCFFCFPDLSCRTPGAFRLKFSLIMVNLARAREVKHFPVLVEAMSDGFTVYTAKDFPGMQESTKLTKRLKEQGRIISINKGADKTKNSRVLNESSEGEQDEGESC